jgi:quinol monooxygenase YgiN
MNMDPQAKMTQVVISRLKKIENRERFIALTRQMVAWLHAQPGFLHYVLYENGRNFSDTLVYASEEAAKRINDDFQKTAIHPEMVSLVESGYTGFFGREVELGKGM